MSNGSTGGALVFWIQKLPNACSAPIRSRCQRMRLAVTSANTTLTARFARQRNAFIVASTFAMSSGGKHYRLTDTTSLTLLQGDITKAKVDAIVNAANERMLGGGGVDGAIHSAAGRSLLEACRKVPEVSPGVRCPTGEARITEGFNLHAKHVIHTVGPVYSHSKADKCGLLLYDAYKNSLALANNHKLNTVAFPAISCGVYGYPVPNAAKVSLDACRDHAGSVKKITFVLFGDSTYNAYVSMTSSLLPCL